MAEEHARSPIVVMGVSAVGKSTVGRRLAELTHRRFRDADDLHPAANIAKMRAGTPLTDDDRWPWLRRVGAELAAPPRGEEQVFACSALRREYRDLLRTYRSDVVVVHLTGTRDQLRARASRRTDHFMPVSLLDSQLASLEPLAPDEPGITVDVSDSPDEIAERIIAMLRRE